MEKPFHWITALGELTMVSCLPCCVIVACPDTTVPPLGFAPTPGAKHEATASATRRTCFTRFLILRRRTDLSLIFLNGANNSNGYAIR
jgi:hypothetical protein